MEAFRLKLAIESGANVRRRDARTGDAGRPPAEWQRRVPASLAARAEDSERPCRATSAFLLRDNTRNRKIASDEARLR